MKTLYYIYYRFYKLMNDLGNGNVAEYYALFLMTLIVFLNIYTITAFCYIFFDIHINIYSESKNIVLMELLFIVIIFYFLFIREKKYLEIAKFYELESKKDKNKGNIFIIFYISLSVVLVFSCFFLMVKKNNGG